MMRSQDICKQFRVWDLGFRGLQPQDIYKERKGKGREGVLREWSVPSLQIEKMLWWLKEGGNIMRKAVM